MRKFLAFPVEKKIFLRKYKILYFDLLYNRMDLRFSMFKSFNNNKILCITFF